MKTPNIRMFKDTRALFEGSVLNPLDGTQTEMVATGTGWHIYADLQIKTSYACSPDIGDRLRTMRAIAMFGKVGMAIIKRHGGDLLEHQGQRIHLWLPRENQSASLSDVVRVLTELDFVVRRDVRPIIPSGWKRFVTAADHGFSVFVRSADINGGDSLVSLAESANTPAKALPHLNDGETWISQKKFSLQKLYPERTILESNASNLQMDDAKWSSAKGYSEALARFEKLDEERQEASARAVPGQEVSQSESAPSPFFGYTFRADIDGFSALVKNAGRNEERLRELVVGFIQTVRNVAEFTATYPHAEFIQLPWAGDCCTFLSIKATSDDYKKSQKKESISFCVDFEDKCGKDWFSQTIQQVGWAYSIAGGDAHGNQHGNLLVAKLTLGSRSFLIAVGRGIYRSLDAESRIKIRREELSLFVEDRNELMPVLKPCFSEANTNYYLSEVERLKKTLRGISAGVAAIPTSTSQVRPEPRPYSP